MTISKEKLCRYSQLVLSFALNLLLDYGYFHENALLKLHLQQLHQRLVFKSHSKCDFILNWPGKVTYITQANKKKSANRSKKSLVNSTALLFNLSDW